MARIELRSIDAMPETVASPEKLVTAGQPLLQASMTWLHSVLRSAVRNFPANPGDTPGYCITRATLLQSLDQGAAVSVTGVDEGALDTAIAVAMAASDDSEPLATALLELDLGPGGLRLLLLALAPDLDLRYQRCFGYLLDNMGFRTGNLGLLPAGARSHLPCDSRRNRYRWTVAERHGQAGAASAVGHRDMMSVDPEPAKSDAKRISDSPLPASLAGFTLEIAVW